MIFKKVRKWYYIHFRWSKKIFLEFRKWYRFFAKIISSPLSKVQLYFASAYSKQNILQTLQICLALNYDLNFPPLVKKNPHKKPKFYHAKWVLGLISALEMILPFLAFIWPLMVFLSVSNIFHLVQFTPIKKQMKIRKKSPRKFPPYYNFHRVIKCSEFRTNFEEIAFTF